MGAFVLVDKEDALSKAKRDPSKSKAREMPLEIEDALSKAKRCHW
jgi:hypothetical protein